MDIEQLIKQEFPLDEHLIYLNHAAMSPWPLRTALAVQQFAEENVSIGAQNYAKWLEKERLLRKQLQSLINAPAADDIALLKNTSEGLSVVAEGIAWQAGDNIVSTDQEFPSNRIPWLAQARHGVEFREVNIVGSAHPEQALLESCDKKTRLLTVSFIQYGDGKRLNLELLGNFCNDNNILFCVDAIQGLGLAPFDVQAIQADFAMADAHKWLLGPEGIALFYCAERARDDLDLHQFGWRMVEDSGNYNTKEWQIAASARRFECGSPNMLGIHALSASLSLIEEINIDNIFKLTLNKVLQIIDNIKYNNKISIISPIVDSELGGIVTFKINAQDNTEIYNKLMKNKVICANRNGGIRLSPHFYTSSKKIDKSLDILNAII